MFKTLLLLLLIPSGVLAQEGKVDATWLHRSISPPNKNDVQAGTCHYKPIFGEGDPDNRILRTVTRFGEFTVAANSKCQAALYDRQEEIYFVVEANAVLHYADQTYPMRTNDFTYLPPAVSHSIANASGQMLRVLVMSFKIPARISIGAVPPAPKIVNLDAVKKQTVEGHPTSVQYKLLLGPRTATRDAIDQAYVVSSFFWMDFVPGGTNFPHHHEAAEEIYLVMDGRGEIVAGGGTDGIEGRYPAAAGDAYYLRHTCAVGFYNQNKPGATANILAIRARVPPPDEDD